MSRGRGGPRSLWAGSGHRAPAEPGEGGAGGVLLGPGGRGLGWAWDLPRGSLVSQSRAVPAGAAIRRGRTEELKGAVVTAEPRGHHRVLDWGPPLEGSRLAVPQTGGPGRRGPSDSCGGVSFKARCPGRLRGLEQAPAGSADRRAGKGEWWASVSPSLPGPAYARRSLAPGT